jgi:transcriptional regulator with XRE-family HTH domain
MDPADFKAARLKLGLTQAQIGKRLGIGERQIRRMENGREPIRDLYAEVIESEAGAIQPQSKGPTK